MGTRVRSLDGLRGLAALVVVCHHSLLTGRIFAAPYAGGPGGRFPSVGWWLTSTPLHLLWGGPEAVSVFFVLSGLVLTRAALRSGFAWRAYYRGRLARLYLPAWGALAFGALAYALVPRTLSPHHTWWVNRHDEKLTWGILRHDAVLVQTPDWLVSPLWSLKWEVLFSLALPFAVRAAARRPRLAIVEAVALVALVAVGEGASLESFVFMPMFGLGALIAVHFDRLAALASGLGRDAWAVTGVAALVLLPASWLIGGNQALVALETVGAVLVVLLFAFCPAVRAFGERPRAQWLGVRSFSLYLVHEPIVVSVALLVDNVWLALLVSVPLSLAVAHVFNSRVEAPCHRLARALSSVSARDAVATPSLGGV